MSSEDVRLGRLRIHVARPQSGSPPGVLLYPTIMGLDATMRAFAAQLAGAGFTAVVWDPYDGEDGTGSPREMLPRSKACEDEQVIADLTSIVDHMQRDVEVGALAGLGWCFGGRIGLLHAGVDSRITVLSAYNPTLYSELPVDIKGIGPMSRADFAGQTMDEFALATAIRGPVQVCRPEHDLTQPAEYDRLLAALVAREDPTLYEHYPHAHHGFSYTPGPANERAHRLAWGSRLSLLTVGLARA